MGMGFEEYEDVSTIEFATAGQAGRQAVRDESIMDVYSFRTSDVYVSHPQRTNISST